jgi:hypothetical protein
MIAPATLQTASCILRNLNQPTQEEQEVERLGNASWMNRNLAFVSSYSFPWSIAL